MSDSSPAGLQGSGLGATAAGVSIGGPVLVVGLGLIGGSIALGLRRALAERVQIWGADLDAGLAKVDEPTLFDRTLDVSSAEFEPATAAAHLVILAAPLPAIEALLERVSAAALVTDCGSAKVDICRRAEELGMAQFVGGHPMAGKERGGFEHASSTLFHGRSWFLCPTPISSQVAIDTSLGLGQLLGARAQLVSAAEHDAGVALTSHVNQLLASAMVKLAGSDRRRFAGPGFEDATRVGGGAASMWSGILERNSSHVAAALAELEGELAQVREGLERADVAPALELLAAARRLKRW